jgi:16S rRNA (guanine966-N2)-methyltransferase
MRIIGGRWRGRRIEAPPEKDLRIRPTSDRVRENLFNILLSRFAGSLAGVHVADICAGTGALGLEALSRGAKFCSFVEKEKASLALIERNVTALGAQSLATLIAADVTRLPVARQASDIVFLDPPYGADFIIQVMELLVRQGWCAENALLCIEQPAGLNLDAEVWLQEDCRTYGKTCLYFFRRQ